MPLGAFLAGAGPDGDGCTTSAGQPLAITFPCEGFHFEFVALNVQRVLPPHVVEVDARGLIAGNDPAAIGAPGDDEAGTAPVEMTEGFGLAHPPEAGSAVAHAG